MADQFSGLGMDMATLSRLSRAETRSISPENFTGARSSGGMAVEGTGADCARDLGVGWKISPSIEIAPGEIRVLADIDGPGAINQIWCTVDNNPWRNLILRMFWDGQEHPSVECPIGDFFCSGWGQFAQVSSLAVCVNPGRGFNSYWEMPFREKAWITLENRGDAPVTLYYQISYTLTDVPQDCAYFHAQFRRSNPVPYGEVHTLLDNVSGQGHYVGTYLAWGVNNAGWWGEGEIKFYLDGEEWPTICGTGTEDYFGGAYNFDPGAQDPAQRHGYTEFTTPYSGLPQVLRPDGVYRSQQRFGLYRWHVTDPVRFAEGLKVTIQALGWRSGRRYLPLQDDVASVAFWYQTLPTAPFQDLQDKDTLEVI